MNRLVVFFMFFLHSLTAFSYVDDFKIGARIQGIMENDNETETQDMYLRRLRVNLEYNPLPGHQIVYDVRNDNANKQDKGEEDFNIGDAYWKIDLNHKYFNDIKLFRSKVAVSYSQTSSSKNLFTPNRWEVSEYASDFLVHNRRASNIQTNGNIGNMYFQLYISDGVSSEDFEDSKGASAQSVIAQKFSYGGKVRYYFIGDAKENKVQDTFYGKEDVFSIGIGAGANDKIIYQDTNDVERNLRRSLVNIDLSYANGPLRFLAESFVFDGAVEDFTSSTIRSGVASGHYAQIEYVLPSRLAPYVGYELFNRFHSSEDDNTYEASLVGLNYYKLDKKMRFGFEYRKVDEQSFGNETTNDKFSTYILVDF